MAELRLLVSEYPFGSSPSFFFGAEEIRDPRDGRTETGPPASHSSADHYIMSRHPWSRRGHKEATRTGNQVQEREATPTNLPVTLSLANLVMVVMDERAPSFFEKFAVKAKQDPLVPIGAMATVGFLVSGMTGARIQQYMSTPYIVYTRYL